MTNKLKLPVVCILLISFCISGCTFTTTKTKTPEFKISTKELSDNLRTLVAFEHVNINGVETTINGKHSSEMLVEIINGPDFPSDNSQLNELAKPIAKQLKDELKNPNDFDTYKIIFITKETSGVVTTSNSRSAILKTEEL